MLSSSRLLVEVYFFDFLRLEDLDDFLVRSMSSSLRRFDDLENRLASIILGKGTSSFKYFFSEESLLGFEFLSTSSVTCCH